MSLEIEQWRVEFRPWGWLRLTERSGSGPAVYLHYQLAAAPQGQERLALRDVVIRTSGDETLSARVWRRLPFTPLEEVLTRLFIAWPRTLHPEIDYAPMIKRAAEVGAKSRTEFTDGVSGVRPPSLDLLDDFFEATKESTVATIEVLPAVMPDSGAEEKARLPRIRPPKDRLTDEFLRDVAEAYHWATESRKAPAPAIAQVAESEVSVRTVHRWIYEARKRGILPPARPGRAG